MVEPQYGWTTPKSNQYLVPEVALSQPVTGETKIRDCGGLTREIIVVVSFYNYQGTMKNTFILGITSIG